MWGAYRLVWTHIAPCLHYCRRRSTNDFLPLFCLSTIGIRLKGFVLRNAHPHLHSLELSFDVFLSSCLSAAVNGNG